MCSPTDPCGACSFCDREQLRHNADRVAEYIEQENDELRRFVTLTLPERGLQAGDSFDAQLDDFETMVDDLMARVEDRKGPTEWVGGIEAQNNQNPHAHLLVDRYLDQNWLVNTWRDCGRDGDRGGYIKTEYTEGDAADVAEYVIAYVGGGVVVGNI